MDNKDGKENTNAEEVEGDVTLTFFDNNGIPFTRKASNVAYVIPHRQNCEIHFKDGEHILWGYPLEYFHKVKVWSTNFFRRLDRFVLVNTGTVVKRSWRKVLLTTGEVLKLT